MIARRRAVTLLEVLVAISVMSTLVALLLCGIQGIRATAVRVACQNQLKQIGLAVHTHESTFSCVPPVSARPWQASHPDGVLSILALLLPYMDEENLYREAEASSYRSIDPFDQIVHTAGTKVVRQFICPADPRLRRPQSNSRGARLGLTSYVVLTGAAKPSELRARAGAFGTKPGAQFSKFTDGLSNILIVAERPPPNDASAGWWYADATSTFDGPNSRLCFGCQFAAVVGDPCAAYASWVKPFVPGSLEHPCDRVHSWSLHPTGGNFLVGDGSVRFLSYTSVDALVPLVGVNDGEGSLSDLP